MIILPLHQDVESYLRERGLQKKFKKQAALFKENPFYPSLETELLEPRHLRFWSFRVDKKYRATFIFRGGNTIEVLDVNNHYQ